MLLAKFEHDLNADFTYTFFHMASLIERRMKKTVKHPQTSDMRDPNVTQAPFINKQSHYKSKNVNNTTIRNG